MTNEWVDFRVYLKPGRSFDEVHEAAEQLREFLSDEISTALAPDCFTEEVVYTVVITSKDIATS